MKKSKIIQTAIESDPNLQRLMRLMEEDKERVAKVKAQLFKPSPLDIWELKTRGPKLAMVSGMKKKSNKKPAPPFPDRMADIPATQRMLYAVCDDVVSRITSVDLKADSIAKHHEARFTSIEGKIENLDSKIDAVAGQLNGKIEAVEVQLNHKIDNVEVQLNNKIDAVEARLNSKIDAVEAQLNHKIDTVEARLNHKIDAVEARLNDKMDKIEARLDHKIETLRTEMNVQFQALIAKLDSQFAKLDARLEKIEARIHKTQLVVEEQNNRNKFVYDGLLSLSDRQERLEKMFTNKFGSA